MTVYVLELQNGKYYVGYTKNIQRRIQSHAHGSIWPNDRNIFGDQPLAQ